METLENTTKPPLTYERLLTPVRVQRSRAKGFKMPDNTVYVGRGSKFGNPFKIDDGFIIYKPENKPRRLYDKKDQWINWSVSKGFTVEDCIHLFEKWITHKLFISNLSTVPDLSELKGKNLACWCPLNKPCHADVLLRLSNGC